MRAVQENINAIGLKRIACTQTMDESLLERAASDDR